MQTGEKSVLLKPLGEGDSYLRSLMSLVLLQSTEESEKGALASRMSLCGGEATTHQSASREAAFETMS